MPLYPYINLKVWTTCSYKDSKLMHCASQKSISVIGPGYLSPSSAWQLSRLRTSSTWAKYIITVSYDQNNLVGPFYDYPFNIGLHDHIKLCSITLPDSALLILNILDPLTLKLLKTYRDGIIRTLPQEREEEFYPWYVLWSGRQL